MKVIAGIDPGKSGALVILYPDNSGLVYPVPTQKIAGKERPAWHEWAQIWTHWLKFAEPEMIVIERVAARPGQGVTSMFNFGQVTGFVRALAMAACPDAVLIDPTPAQWKGKFGLLNSDKNASREKVRSILPKLAHTVTRVKDDGVAEAALLALYGRTYS